MSRKKPDPLEAIKMEIADEIGVLDKVRMVGWGGLNAAETGRIGGLLNSRLKQEKQKRRKVMEKEQLGIEKRTREKMDSADNTDHPERDQFIEGKIGSGYMSTIEGQPNLQGAAKELNEQRPESNKLKNINEKTPGAVEN